MIKPTKATRAAAPDLFGTPAYFNDGTHHAALIEQLKGLGLTPAAWALEDLLEKSELADEQAERVYELEQEQQDLQKSYDAMEIERDNLQSFFEHVVARFEDNNGRWPGAEPDDNALRNAIAEDFEKAAEARRAGEEDAQ